MNTTQHRIVQLNHDEKLKNKIHLKLFMGTIFHQLLWYEF